MEMGPLAADPGQKGYLRRGLTMDLGLMGQGHRGHLSVGLRQKEDLDDYLKK